MSRSTKALKRLGVPGLAAVTMVAGLPLFLGTAQAAHVQGLALSPNSSSDNAGVCVPYTVQVDFVNDNAPEATVIDVTLTEGTASATQDADFCTAPTGTTQPATGGDLQDSGAAGSSDHAEFTTDATGKVTFGVTANEAGTVQVRAFHEHDDNDTFNAGEPQDVSTQTFTAAGPAGSNANQDAAGFVEVVGTDEPSPATATVTVTNDADSVVEGETRTYRVFVGSDADSRLAGVTVSYAVNSDVSSADRSAATFGVTDNNGIATGTITFPARTEASGTTSTDNVTFWVNQTGTLSTPNQDIGEPGDALAVTVRDAAAQQNRSVTLTPESRTQNVQQNSATYTAVIDDPRTTGADNATTGTLVVFGVSGGSGDETVTVDNQTPGGAANECTTGTNTTSDANDSSCVVTVTDPTPVAGQTLTITATVRGSSQADSSTLTFANAVSDARFISLTPEAVTVAPNNAQQLTATVTDVDGKPVQGIWVRFTESGAGAFRNGSSDTSVQTNSEGVATIEVISLPGETGTMTVKASISQADTGQATQCAQAAGAGTDPQGNNLNSTGNPGTEPAGNCTDTSTVTFGTASPSPSATPTGTATPSPVDCSVTPTVTLEFGTINATGSSGVTVNAPANSQIQLLAYSQPDTTYRVVRGGANAPIFIDAAGTPYRTRVVPPTNTRLYAQIVGCDTDETRFSKVLNVRTTLSLNVTRTGTRAYRFFGDSLPARPGGLIVSLYRVTNDGRQILTAQTRANAQNGDWVINRTFTGTGRFGFVVRTGQDLQNAPGTSNVRSLLIF